jgi:hypothetical protein
MLIKLGTLLHRVKARAYKLVAGGGANRRNDGVVVTAVVLTQIHGQHWQPHWPNKNLEIELTRQDIDALQALLARGRAAVENLEAGHCVWWFCDGCQTPLRKDAPEAQVFRGLGGHPYRIHCPRCAGN